MADQLTVTDQMGREVSVPSYPQRIVSLVPSQTELLFDLGLEDRIAGVTKFCVHPRVQTKLKPQIGGTKNFNFDRIDSLKPDLIIGNKEENYLEGISELSTRYPIWMSDINDLNGAHQMIESIGVITDVREQALQLSANIKRAWQSIPDFKGTNIIYLIWRKPYMVAGKGTFIDHVLETLGLKNAIPEERYPEIDPSSYVNKSSCIFLSSEPYPFKEKHLQEVQGLFGSSKAVLVDGEIFSWYGSRLLKAPEYFRELHTRIG